MQVDTVMMVDTDEELSWFVIIIFGAFVMLNNKKEYWQILLVYITIQLSGCNYCKVAEDIANQEVKGIVDSKKKLEWNRDEQTIIYLDSINKLQKYEILRDNSGLWDFVQKGDSLYKPLNIKKMKVYRKGVLAGEFLMDIGCPKNLRDEK